MQKTYYKTASLISNSCKAIALLAGQTTEVAMLAFEYGKNLVCDFFLSFFFLFFFLGNSFICSKLCFCWCGQIDGFHDFWLNLQFLAIIFLSDTLLSVVVPFPIF